MKIYEVYEYGMNGAVLGFVEADNEKEAKVKLSIEKYGHDNTDLVKTYYYGAKEITLQEYAARYSHAAMELAKFNLGKSK